MANATSKLPIEQTGRRGVTGLSGSVIFSGADGLAVVTLLAAGAVIGWPVLSGGYVSYLDNPAHLAEVYAGAGEARNGWSEIAFCGFPIATLHSPLWYGILSFLSRVGVPAGIPYVLCLWLGFVAPSLALYSVARRTLSPLFASMVAYTLLVQRPAIVGIGSAFGGMWTFFLAAAALIVLAGRLSRSKLGWGNNAGVAALTGFILLTHLYAVVPLVLLLAVHTWVSIGKRNGNPRVPLYQIAAAFSGVVAAALYWAPMVLARSAMVIRPQDLKTTAIVARLLVPTHVLDLVNGQIPALTSGVVLESVPMILLVAAGVAGVFSLARRKDDTPLYGAIIAAVLLVVLLFVTSEFDIEALGPGSWRLLYFVRAGLMLAAVPFVSRVENRVYANGCASGIAAKSGIAAAVVAVLLGGWFGRPLRDVVAPRTGPEVVEVVGLWEWLEAHRTNEWGRVYLQDTFEKTRAGVKLSQSHVLALTAHKTGVRQLGATYGVAPYRTVDWTPSEFGTLFRSFVRDSTHLDRVETWMWAANVTHVVTSEPRTREQLELSDDFTLLHKTGRFAVFRAETITPEWVSPLVPGVTVSTETFETGYIRLFLRSSRPGRSVFVKSSYHPAWRLAPSCPPGTRLLPEENGLMRLENFGVGEHSIEIGYHPARWPAWLSFFGWHGIAWMFIARKVRRRSG